VRQHDIAVVHTHMPLPAVMARLVLPPARRGGPAFVHTEHNMWGRYRWPTRWANRLTYRRNAAVIAVSDGVAQSIKSKVPVEVVIHGIDSTAMHHGAEARTAARLALDLGRDAPVIGTVGNFTAKKDQATLIDAFAQVHAGRADAKLLLVGLGPLEDQLRAQASRLGLAGAVVFTGMRDDVFELLPALDVFVLSSRFEGLPIALLEAMASGVAPVATRVGGIPEVITDGEDGLLIDPGDPGVLAAALSKLLADDTDRARMANAARHRSADFDLGKAVHQIEAIYDDVLAKGPGT
jgi:glycosyltransferase involved in cell wall biosynthesis